MSSVSGCVVTAHPVLAWDDGGHERKTRGRTYRGGYLLVIRDGAMIGLEYDEPWPDPPDRGNCRVYWGSHGCDFKRGHEGSCACDCCECPDHPHHPEEDEWTCVAKPPYYGPETRFYGEDVAARGLPALD